MGVLYTRNKDGELKPVHTVHVLTEGTGEWLDAEIREFNQMNDLVTAYLEAADAAYTDDNADTVSVIADYETNQGNADRPVGYPLSISGYGTTYLQNEVTGNGWKLQALGGDAIRGYVLNAIPGEVSQYLVKDSDGKLLENGRIKPTGKVRMIRFMGNHRNCRDLGGWNCDGGTVKYGKLFRSAATVYLEDWIDPTIAKNIGIRHEMDFRSEASDVTASAFGSEIRYHRFPIVATDYFGNSIKLDSVDIESLKGIFRTIFDAAVHNEGLLYHCSLGRDRTGTVTILILALLGVAKADIDKDHELSSFSGYDSKTINSAPRNGAGYRGMFNQLATFNGTSLRNNVVRWFTTLGFTLDELNAFRSAMINGTPDILEESSDDIVNYQIVSNLTNCATSNTETYTTSGSSYTTTLTFTNDRNTFSSVSVIMGTTDVTANVYSNGVITIPSVTGDVTITAVAITNQIPISTDVDGNIFNDTGWKANVRLDGSGDVVEHDNISITGFIPCKSGDVIRFKNMDLDTTSSLMSGVRLAFYGADKNVIAISSGSYASVYWNTLLDKEGTEISTDNILQSIVIPTYNSEVAFARFGTHYISNKSIITVNEEI